jgi:hypothetical protein
MCLTPNDVRNTERSSDAQYVSCSRQQRIHDCQHCVKHSLLCIDTQHEVLRLRLVEEGYTV